MLIRIRPGAGAGRDHRCDRRGPALRARWTADRAELRQFTTLGARLMVGLSGKGMIGTITGRPVEQRLAGSVSAVVLAVRRGAHLLRVHDVAATRDAVAVLAAVELSREG